MNDEYDLIVLGGGPVGENVADRAVQGGLTALIVESELVGGESGVVHPPSQADAPAPMDLSSGGARGPAARRAARR